MPVPQRVFLSWRQPAATAVAERMLAWSRRDPDTFRRSLALLPTRASCRRLRLELARLAGVALTPRILPVGQFLAPAAEGVAPPSVELAAWVETIDALRGRLPVLFPRAASWHGDNLLDVAVRLQELAEDLCVHGLDAEAVEAHASGRERERWRELGLVLSTWKRLVAGAGFVDSLEAAARERRSPSLLKGLRGRVVLACVPGVPGPVRQALEESHVPVEAWVHAPEEWAGMFDGWGAPSEEWLGARIDLDEDMIVSAENAVQLAERACDALAATPEGGARATLGLADSTLYAPLAQALEERGAGLFRPDGEPLAETGWMTLLRLLAEEVDSPGYAAPLLGLARSTLAACGLGLRHHELFCRELSVLEQQYFPETAESVRSLLASGLPRTNRTNGDVEAIPDAGEDNLRRICVASWEALERWTRRATASGDALLAGLAEWANRCAAEAPSGAPDGWREGAEFVAGEVNALRMYPGLKPRVVLGLLAARLARARFVPPRGESACYDASGWMEMLFAPERHLVLAGMTEGVVPEAPRDDALLTERLRRALGMEHAGGKTARDSYLLRDLVESRREEGSMRLLFARTSAQGDPLPPSSLLFRCRDEELPDRVLRLFGPPSRPQGGSRELGVWGLRQLLAKKGAATPETEVEALLPGFVNPWKGGAKGFSPSRLNAFWACPMRFWLAEAWRLRGEEPVVDKATLDAREVGNVLHEVLRQFAMRFPSAASLAGRSDRELETAMDELLHAALGGAAERFYLPAAMQRRNMRRRLHAYVRLHRREMRDGWECALFEHAVGPQGEPWSWQGFPMEFRLDRLDVWRDATGRVRRVRVVDYKTGSPESIIQGGRPSPASKCLQKGGDPEMLAYWFPGLSFAAHGCGARATLRRWADLQMPVYAAWAVEWARERFGLEPGDVSPWYCFLPADPWKTCMAVWEDFCTLRDSADGEEAGRDAGCAPAESGRLWALAAMSAITRGTGFVSAEQLGWEPPLYDRLKDVFGAAPDLRAWTPEEPAAERRAEP